MSNQFFSFDSGPSQETELDEWDKVAAQSVRKQKPKPVTPNLGAIVAQFIRFYGWSVFDGGRIPWKQFWFLHNQIPSVLALERHNLISGMTIAGTLLMGDDNSSGLAKREWTATQQQALGI